MKAIDSELLNQLELTYSYLKEDIKALDYLQEDYFISNKPIEDFEQAYFKIQNLLEVIIKAMKLNELNIKICINKIYHKI